MYIQAKVFLPTDGLMGMVGVLSHFYTHFAAFYFTSEWFPGWLAGDPVELPYSFVKPSNPDFSINKEFGPSAVKAKWAQWDSAWIVERVWQHRFESSGMFNYINTFEENGHISVKAFVGG